MRPLLHLSALITLVGCSGVSAPRDASNASLPTTGANQVGNVHAIREIAPTPAVRDLLATSDRTADGARLPSRVRSRRHTDTSLP